MLIISQNKKTIVNLNAAGQIYVDNSIGHEKPCVYCDFGDGRTAVLGEYETEKRATEVLTRICEDYQYSRECSARGEVAAKQPAFVFNMPEE